MLTKFAFDGGRVEIGNKSSVWQIPIACLFLVDPRSSQRARYNTRHRGRKSSPRILKHKTKVYPNEANESQPNPISNKFMIYAKRSDCESIQTAW
jgi:hypothetical protein